MRLVFNHYTKYKVLYFGVKLLAPAGSRFIATDEDGGICAFTERPFVVEDIWDSKSTSTYLGTVDLEGLDFKDSLLEIGQV